MKFDNNEASLDKFKKEVKKHMNLRWNAVKGSTCNMMDLLSKMTDATTLEELAKIKISAKKMREELRSQLEELEFESATEKPALMN